MRTGRDRKKRQSSDSGKVCKGKTPDGTTRLDLGEENCSKRKEVHPHAEDQCSSEENRPQVQVWNRDPASRQESIGIGQVSRVLDIGSGQNMRYG